ncbi:hypothetical protein ACFW04_002208 [Cataglyphis niger]
MSEYCSSEETLVADYFKRFKWALSPCDPEDLQFAEIRTILVNHFDQTKNKYVESIKFRQIVQQKGESVASFSLCLKQADMCDEIIAKKSTTFNAAYEIAHSFEATRNTANKVGTIEPLTVPEVTNKLGYETPKTKERKQIINVKIDSRNLEMELDTGASCGIIGVSRCEIKPHFSLQKTNRKFSSYTAHHIDCLGRIPMNVTVGSTTRKLNLYLTGPPAMVHLKPGTSPIFAKTRDVLLALRDQYAKKIDAKIASEAYEKLKRIELRIIGNYKSTVNPRMIIDEHSIPKIEYIFNKMKGATLFWHLDITDAYTHLPINDKFRHQNTFLALECLGHKIDRHGLHKSDKHIAAIRDAPQPASLKQLQLFLGKATYYNQNTNADYCSQKPYPPTQNKVNKLSFSEGRNQRIGYKAPEAYYILTANCLLFEHRVIISSVLRQSILDNLHTSSLHRNRKNEAQSFMYWPSIDSNIERTAKSCYSKGPWEQIHIDYARPVAGALLLVIVDVYNKWFEVKITNSSTTVTIKILNYLLRNMKDSLKVMSTMRNSLQTNLNKLLRQYRKTPNTTTRESPSKLFLGRNLRTRLDLVRPQEV